MEDIKCENVEWLWYPFVPYGKITIIQGDPGEGKTTLVLQMIAKLTRGETIINEETKEPINVIYQTAEDGLSDTIKPRLVAANADCSKVLVIDDKENGIKLNEEALVKEFSSIYKLRKDIKTFDDLKEIYAHRRTAHARSKLKFYDEVSDEFIQLNSKDNESRAKEIEKHKADIALKKSLDYEKYLNPVVEAAKAKEISSKENENKSSEKESKYSYNFSKAQEEIYVLVCRNVSNC